MPRALPTVRDHAAPRLGAYCPFTGRAVRPFSRRLGVAVLEVVLVLGLLLHGLHLFANAFGPAGALGVGMALAAVFAAARVEPRARAIALAVVALISFVSAYVALERSTPLPAEGLGGFAGPAVMALARADEACLQAFGMRCYPVVAVLLGGIATTLLAFELVAAWRARDLPKRLWFARHHPVWRRAYMIGESAYPTVGVLAVDRDPLLAEKLVFLVLPRDGSPLRLAATPELGARQGEPYLPLAELPRPAWLWLERGQVCLRGEFERDLAGGALEVRLFLRALHAGSKDKAALGAAAPVADLPIADYFAADDALYAKRYARPQARRLFGLLFDSRPVPSGGDVPRFSALIMLDGRIHVERPHPDLLGPPRVDLEHERVLVPWRNTGDEPLTLELERGRDQVIAVRARGELYHLLFVAFGGART